MGMNSELSPQCFEFTFDGCIYKVQPIKGFVETQYERRSYQMSKDKLNESKDILSAEDYADEARKLYEANKRGEYSLEFAMNDPVLVKNVALRLLSICFDMSESDFQKMWMQAYDRLLDLFFELMEHAYPVAKPLLEAKKKQLPGIKMRLKEKLDLAILKQCENANDLSSLT